MKITQKQLKRIIREELTKQLGSTSQLNEAGLAMDSSQYFSLTDDLRKNLFAGLFAISDKLGDELGEYELADELTGLVEDFARRHNINL